MKGRQPSASDYEIVCGGAAVRLSAEAHAEYRQVLDGKDKNSVKRRTHLARYFRDFCENNRHRLSAEKFKKEGNFSDGKGGMVAIWTFKVWQWRLYGAMLRVNNHRCFVGVRVDASKKQDRANQEMLRNAALDIAALVEYGS